MNTYTEFAETARARFPALAEKADRLHLVQWGEPPTDDLHHYSWFESMANALNAEMRHGTDAKQFRTFFEFVRASFHTGSDDVRHCIDVSLVENLFWSVPAENARPYWDAMPPVLRELYIVFHRRPPV